MVQASQLGITMFKLCLRSGLICSAVNPSHDRAVLMCEFFWCDYCVLLNVNMLHHVEVMFIQLLNLLIHSNHTQKNSYINFTSM